MDELLAKVVPLAVGAAFSPTLLTVLVIILGAPLHPRSRGAAFAVGAAVVLGGLTVVSLTLMGHRVTGATRRDPFYAWVDLAAALLLVLIAIRAIVHPRQAKPRASESADTGVHPLRFVGLGIVMMLTNFSTIVLYIPAMKQISIAPVSTTDQALAVALVFLITTVTLWLPLGLYAAAPSLGRRLLEPVDRFLTRNSRVITVVVCAVFAVYLGIVGVRGL